MTAGMMPAGENDQGAANAAMPQPAPAFSAAPRSLIEELAALRNPGPAPAGWMAMCGVFLALSLIGVAIACYTGWRDHGWPAEYLQDGQWGTWLSAGPLMLSGLLGLGLAWRWRSLRRQRNFWLAAGLTLLFIAGDDLLRFHENLELMLVTRYDLPKEHPLVSRINDSVIILYGLIAAVYTYRNRQQLLRFPWACIALGIGGIWFAGMVICDVLHISATVEETMKVLATICILSAVLAIRRTADAWA